MRALQLSDHSGPAGLRSVEVPDADDINGFTGQPGVLIEVHAAGVSFPELLQSRGEYQYSPELPFIPGGEVAGIVRSAPAESGFTAGDRVGAYPVIGGFAELVAAPPYLTVKLNDALSMAQGAGLIVNYQTAWFALTIRGRLEAGQSVLIHGAAGGVGTASIQVARGLGARTIAVVSDAAKEAVARAAGADEVLRSDGEWSKTARELSGGGVDLVIDPVGGDRMTDSLRALAEGGQVVVVGFAGGAIPEVKVNRLLLRNAAVVGAGWGAYSLGKPDLCVRAGQAISDLVDAGFVAPIVGEIFPFDRAQAALELLQNRGATGKLVLDVTSAQRTNDKEHA